MTEIRDWLKSEGLEEYTELFVKHEIDFDVLSDVKEEHLENIGIPLGGRIRIQKAIKLYRSRGLPAQSPAKNTSLNDQPTIKRSAQRRQMTFVYADLVDSTSISERLEKDEEKYVLIMAKVHEVYKKAITEYLGCDRQYQGDRVFASFGYPDIGEDKSERAVSASLAIVKAIQNIDVGIPLHVRIGISTGPAVIGDLLGMGFPENDTVMAKAANVGSKIQQLASPDTVFICDVTKKLLGQQFLCKNLGLKEIAGLSEPVNIWQVLNETTSSSRFEARRKGTLPSFIGHHDKVETLRRLWLQSLGKFPSLPKNGQIAFISGEPGIGKSRITQELCDSIEEDHTALHYQCSPNHRDSAFYPIITQITANANFNKDDSEDSKFDKLTNLLGEDHGSTSILVTVFAHLLSIDSNKLIALDDKSPKFIKDLTLDFLLQRCIDLSKRKPLLIVFEDLQWIDPTSQELIDRLVGNISDIEAILIATYRSKEYKNQWKGQPHVENIQLSRLSRPEAHEIIKQQTYGEELPKHLVDLIIEKTDGTPLFIEELTKSVLEMKSEFTKNDSYSLSRVFDDMLLPVTLQGTLTSRIDRLPDAGKDLAPICATIGRTFSYALLEAVTNLNADTLNFSLEQLVEAQLLFKYGQEQDSTYTFKHALIQDAAYESQLRSKRIKAHENIAEIIIKAGDSRPELIAHHYQAAGKYEEAFKYWIEAGDNGLKTGATKETGELLKNADHYLSSYEETETNRPDRLEYYLLLGKTLNASEGSKSDEAEQAFWDAAYIAEKIGNTEKQIHALDSVFGIIFNSGDTNRSIGPAETMIEVGKAKNYRVGTTSGLQSKGMVMFTRGEFEEAKDFLEEALIDYEDHIAEDNSYPSLAFMYLAWTLYILGYKENAVIKCKESIDSARGLNKPSNSAGEEHDKDKNYSLAPSLGNSCYLYQFAGDLPSIRANAGELIDLAKSKGQLMWLSRGQFFQNWLDANEKNDIDSLKNMVDEVQKLLDAKEEIETTYYLGLIAETQLNLKMFNQAKDTLDQALELVTKNGEAFYRSELLRIYGDLIQQSGNKGFEKSSNYYYQKSLEVAEKQSAQLWMKKSYLV